MEVKDAVRKAADYVADLESITDTDKSQESKDQILRDMRFAIEGTHYDENHKGKGRWHIEVGFARPWDQASASPLAGLSGTLGDKRTLKTVTIDDKTGKVLAYGSN